MKVLTIGTDKTVLESGSVVNQRQVEYYKNFAQADMVVLATGTAKRFTIDNVNFIHFGGSTRLVNFIKTFYKIVFTKKEYDLIYTQDVLYTGIFGYLYKTFRKTKLVVQIHGDYLDNPLWINQRFENKILNFVAKRIVKKADYIRCVSERIVKFVTENLKKGKDKVKSLPIGIDGEVFNKLGALSPIERKKEIIFVGRLMEEKEPIFFCEIVIPILKKYPEFSVVIIGVGNLQAKMESLFSEAGLSEKVKFTGFLNFKDMAKYYKEGFVYLHTAFWEGWGLPMVEASACGCPVLTTDTGCAGEAIINNGNGIILDSKNKEDFILALEKMINDENFYRELCYFAIRTSEEWNFKTMSKKIEDFLIYAKEN